MVITVVFDSAKQMALTLILMLVPAKTEVTKAKTGAVISEYGTTLAGTLSVPTTLIETDVTKTSLG